MVGDGIYTCRNNLCYLKLSYDSYLSCIVGMRYIVYSNYLNIRRQFLDVYIKHVHVPDLTIYLRDDNKRPDCPLQKSRFLILI